MNAKTLSVIELARLAGVNYNTAYRWLWFDLLPARRIGGRWTIEREVADQFLRDRRARLDGGNVRP